MTPSPDYFDPTPIIGEVGPDGMTREQHARLAEHMFDRYRAAVATQKSDEGSGIGEAVRGPLLTDAFGLPPPRSTGDADVIAAERHMSTVIHSWLLGAHTVLFPPSYAATFVDWLKDNKITHFAGPNVSDQFLTANTLYGIDFSQDPISLVPAGEDDKPPRITVSSVSFLVTCENIIAPFPTNDLSVYEADMQEVIKGPDFRRRASVLAWIVEGGTNKVYVYAGSMQYGSGGARMYPVKSLTDVSNALTNANFDPSQRRMARLGQFVCSMVTSLVRFVGPQYDELAARALPAPEETEVTYD